MSEDNVGTEFAEALSRKDFARVVELVDPDLDFRGLTPNRTWQSSSAAEFVSEVLEKWFEEPDVIEEMIGLQAGAFADRDQVAYRFRGHNGDGPFVVEQQAYYTTEAGRINWLRVICSGMRPPPA